MNRSLPAPSFRSARTLSLVIPGDRRRSLKAKCLQFFGAKADLPCDGYALSAPTTCSRLARNASLSQTVRVCRARPT